MAKILVLEADKILAGNLSRYLRNSGHSVTWSSGPQEAIEQTDKNQPDVIVTDLVLGEHSGVEFLYELRSYPEWQDLPVIILSTIAYNDLASTGHSLKELNIAEFYYKSETSLPEIAKAIDLLSQPLQSPAGLGTRTAR